MSTRLDDSSESAEWFFSDFLSDWVDSCRNSGSGDDQDCCGIFVAVVVAVAALLAFVQCNITGPLEKLPAIPTLAFTTINNEGNTSESLVKWESWAQYEIMSVGSELLGKFSNLQYLVFAKKILSRTKDLLLELDESTSSTIGLRSISWWLLRLSLIQQRLLVDLSSSLFDLLQVNKNASLCHFGTVENVRDYWGPMLSEQDGLNLVSAVHLEAGLVDLTYGRVDSAGNHFEAAQSVSRLDFSVTGAMGFRTIHQVEPKAQLFLVTGNGYGDSVDYLGSGGSVLRHPPETHEASDVLMAPKISEDASSSECDNHHMAAIQLKPVQQAVILAKCLALEKGGRSDEYQLYKMGPYIEAIDAQKVSYFILHYFCNILRVRWESTRSRTKQRAILMMDKLVETINEPSPGASARMYCCFALGIPTFPAVRKEYADLLVSCGLIGEALKVYEDLELWDNLIYCYRVLEKKSAAVDLIKVELTKRPQDSRLWCSLADVTSDDTYYEKALEISGNNSARALRSLARSAYNKADYEKSKALWESAMRLNSLYQDGWFALGAAALKARDVDMALDGFTRAVQLDPENGEAWNNIACLHMVKKRNKESFVAFKEALKLKRNSWQMWENFSHVAADVGSYSQAMDAVCKVMDMTKNKRIDVDLLERLMGEVERLSSTISSKIPAATGDDDCSSYDQMSNLNINNGSTNEESFSRNRESVMLIELLGKVLRQAIHGGGSADIWGLYARWHKLKGDLTMCSEALLKQVRAYQGSDLWRDTERFRKFAHASLELCKVYQELSSRTGGRRELFAAEMHLKGIMKQAAAFSDTDEYRNLLDCLSVVQQKLEDGSMAAV